jgi:hypothetical protein
VVQDPNVAGMYYIEGKTCPKKFPSLEFKFETTEAVDKVLAVPAASFLRQNGANCEILVTKGDSTFELGHPFFQNYYLIFDGENKKVGMSLSSTNMFPEPAKPATEAFPLWIIITIVVVVVAVALLAVIIICVRRRGKNDDEETRAIYKQVEQRQDKDDTYG